MTRTYASFLPLAALVVLLAAAAEPAAAQVPFFGAGATIFDPEIGVVQSGIVSDVQATVSADRKYVTLNMRAANAQLLSLNEFAFQLGNGGGGANGFVGGAGAADANGNGPGGTGAGGPGAAGASGAGGRPSTRRSTTKQARPKAPKVLDPSILDRPGMTRLAPAGASTGRSDVAGAGRVP